MSYGGPPPSNNGGFGAPPPPNNGGFGGPPPPMGGGGGGFGGGFGGPPPGGGGFNAMPPAPMTAMPAKSGGGAGTVLMIVGGIILLTVGGSCLAGFLMYSRARSAVAESTGQFSSAMAVANAAQQQAAMQAQMANQAAMQAQQQAAAMQGNPYGTPQQYAPPAQQFPGGAGAAGGPRMLPDPTLAMSPPRVNGGLDVTAVAPVFATEHAAMVQCFNTARSGSETIMRPQVRMSVILRGGAVVGTPYVGTLSSTVDACIQGVLQRAAWPSSPRMTIISMPTDLSQ